MGRNFPTDIVYVRQFRGRQGAIYDVEMSSVMSSNRIRTAFGQFFRRGSAGPPAQLANITLTNSLTFSTRVRVRLMKEVAKKHQLANSDLIVFVTNFLPRPVLKIKEKRGPMSTYTFCETMQRFSHHLSQDFLAATSKFANVHVPKEELTPTFLLLSPDLLGTPPAATSGSPGISPAPSSAPSGRGSASKRRRQPSGSQSHTIQHGSGLPTANFVSTSKRGRGRGPSVISRSRRGRGPIAPMETDTEPENSQNEPEAILPISIEPFDFSALNEA